MTHRNRSSPFGNYSVICELKIEDSVTKIWKQVSSHAIIQKCTTYFIGGVYLFCI